MYQSQRHRAGSVSSLSSNPQSRVPRDLSTSSLIDLDPKFTRASRSKQQLHSHAMSSTPSMVSSKSRAIPRSQSFQQAPTIAVNEQRLHRAQGSGKLRKSESLTVIPTTRRPSVERVQVQPFRNHNQFSSNGAFPHRQPFHGDNYQLQQHGPPHQQQIHEQQQQSQPQQSQPLRRHANRPTQSFMFPNGEVYIPRNKQRGSLSNLNKLNTTVVPQSRGPSSAPSMLARPMSNHSSSGGHSSSNSSSTIVSDNGVSTTSNTLSIRDNTLTLSFPTSSASPSPSRTSRTNSSLGESTPPSSVDDFTVNSNGSTSGFMGKPGDGSVVLLQKIEELSSTTDDTLTRQHQHSEHNINTDDKSNSATPGDVENTKSPVDVRREDRSQRVPSPPQIQLPAQKRESQQLKASIAQEKQHATAPPATSLQKRYTKVEVERKPSGLKKFLSRIFSSKKKNKHATNQIPKSPLSRVINDDSSTSVCNAPAVDKQQAATPALEHHQHQEQEQEQVLMVQPPISADNGRTHESNSVDDTFSFLEGDEDAGINVAQLPLDVADGDFDDDDYKSELILDTLFSRLSGTSDVKSIDLKKRDKEPQQKQRAVQPSDADDEDYVMTFDDMEFIEKITEFGETSFPDLAQPDMGQSHRKLLRSKSIERRRSIRSISSSSKWSTQANTNSVFVPETVPLEQMTVVTTNRPRSPVEGDAVVVESIMKHGSELDNKAVKSVQFDNRVFVNVTYPSTVYNRHSVPVSSYKLGPQMVQHIRRELNEFKRHMVVHQQSIANTHFFRP